MDWQAHMDLMETALKEHPKSPEHIKLLCSQLIQLLTCSLKSRVELEVNFGDVPLLYKEVGKKITIVNDTKETFLFMIRRMQLTSGEKTSESNFRVETEDERMDFTVLPFETHCINLSYKCKLLNCYQFDYFELSLQIIDSVNWTEDIGRNSEVIIDKMDGKRERKHRKETRKNKAKNSQADREVINQLEEIKLNMIAQQVCEIDSKPIEGIKKSIKINLSGVCLSPKVFANKKVIKIQGAQKKSFKVFNDSLEKSAHIQVAIDASNCPIQFSRLCAVIKPKSSISIDVRLNLNLFVTEYFYKAIYIFVLNNEPLQLDVYSCFHSDFNIENIECLDHFLGKLKTRCKSIRYENECFEEEMLSDVSINTTIVNELFGSNFIRDTNDSTNILERLFSPDKDKYLTIQPNSLELDKHFYKKEFIVKNNLNLKLFIIWNKDYLNKILIQPPEAVVNEYGTVLFSVEFVHDEQEILHQVELSLTTYYGDKLVNINLNQGKYEKRAERLEFFLPYSCSMKFRAHSFSSGHSWIPHYEINQEQFTFQFLLNNHKQTSMAYSSILIRNCGNLPLHYSIKKVKNNFFSFETLPSCNYIKSNKDDQENFHIVYAHLVLKEALPGSHLKRSFVLCLNTDDIYSTTKTFDIYYSNSLDMTVPYWLIANKMCKEECEPIQEEQNVSLENTETTKSILKNVNDKKTMIESTQKVKTTAKTAKDPKSAMNPIIKVHGKKTEASEVFSIPIPLVESVESIEHKPRCWNKDITEYILVTFPPMHPKCSTVINLPLYNESQHTIFYEFEEVHEQISTEDSELSESIIKWSTLFSLKSGDTIDAFSLPKTSGHALPYQLVENKCVFHPTECGEYSQILRCKQNCLISNVQLPDQYFMLKGVSVPANIHCSPTKEKWGDVQSQFFINGSFQLQHTQNCTVNCLLRCKIQNESDTTCINKPLEKFSDQNIYRNDLKCYTVPKIRMGPIETYEELLNRVEYFDINRFENGERAEKFLGKWDCKRNNTNENLWQNEVFNDDSIMETNEIYIDSLGAHEDQRTRRDIKTDFIILDPYLAALHPGESKTINFLHHPYIIGKYILNFQLYVLENALEDELEELKYEETSALDLLSIQYTCIDCHLQIVDINITNNGRSKCFSSSDYYNEFLNIPDLNRKLSCKETTRIEHEFDLPFFEINKEISFELVVQNFTSTSHFHIIHLDDGLCNICSKKNELEGCNIRLCKHFKEHINIEPDNMECIDKGILKFSVKFGCERFHRFILKNTGHSTIQYRTVFCMYVDNDTHRMCIVKKYLYLIIRPRTVVPEKPTLRFLLPVLGYVMDNKVQFYSYELLIEKNYIQPFWLNNNTSHDIAMSVNVGDEEKHIIQAKMNKFTIKSNTRYPILFFMIIDEELDHFHFEINDDISNTSESIKIKLISNEYQVFEQKEKSINFFANVSKNSLKIRPIPLHHTTKRKITLKNIYQEVVVFSWDRILIHGVMEVDVEPKFGILQPSQCKQMDLVIKALTQPTKLNLVLSVELCKEKHYVKYFETLVELVEMERARSDICIKVSRDGAVYKGIDIEDYGVHARPKPNVQTIGIEVSSYNVLHQETIDELLEDNIGNIEMNSKLNEDLTKKYILSSDLKLNKFLLNDIKSIFQECYWYFLKQIDYNTEAKPKSYEEMKSKLISCKNFHSKLVFEDLFDVIFQKILYKHACDIQSALRIEFEIFEGDREEKGENENANESCQDLNYDALLNIILETIDKELVKQVFGEQIGGRSRIVDTTSNSIEEIYNDDFSSIDIIGDDSNDSNDKLITDYPKTKKESMNNEYFNEIITASHTD